MAQFRPYAYAPDTGTANNAIADAAAATIAAHGPPPTNLTDRAVLADLTLRRWSARKSDKRMTAQVTATNGLAKDMANVTKALMPPGALDKIVTLQGAWRNYHLSVTLPWQDGASRVLPSSLYLPYDKRSREFKTEHDAYKQEFVQAYPQHYHDVKLLLNGAFDPADYPPAYEIASRFDAHVTISGFPDPQDFRLPSSFAQSDIEAIKAQALQDMTEALKQANLDIIKRMHAHVKHMVERLNAYDPTGDKVTGKFHDTLVTNIEEQIMLIPALNITNDPQVTTFAKECVGLLKYDPEQLRSDDKARSAIATEAERISKAMAQFV